MPEAARPKHKKEPTKMETNNTKPQGIVPCTDWLAAGGWREYPNQFKKYARCFYKSFDTPTRCHCNADKPGIQIEIAVSERDGRVSYEMELSGELKDETWIRLHNHGLPDDIRKVVALIPRLLAVWEAANSDYTAKH